MVHNLAGLRRGLKGGSCAKLLLSDTKGGVTDAVGGAVDAADDTLVASGSGREYGVLAGGGDPGAGCSAVVTGSGGAAS